MSIVLTVLLTALKIVGILLLVVLALLLLAVLALCIPTGVRLEYQKGGLTVAAKYGPLHIRLYPRKKKKEKSGDDDWDSIWEEEPPPTREPEPAPPESPEPVEEEPLEPPSPPQNRPKAEKKKKAKSETDQSEADAPAPNRRVQAFLDRFKEDPMLMIETILGHLGFAGGRVLHGIHVRHLRVFWTVTVEHDAAATAIQYGQQIALLNNLLVRAREHLDIRADSLWLEPDFTGERKGERAVLCTVYLHPIVLVLLVPRLLFRVWKDPTFAGILS